MSFNTLSARSQDCDVTWNHNQNRLLNIFSNEGMIIDGSFHFEVFEFWIPCSLVFGLINMNV